VLSPPEPIDSGPWMLDPQITYLNHGSFGARTKQVFQSQQEFKKLFERSPIDFLDRSRHDLINETRDVVSSFLHCDPAGLGFVDNATTGVGCVVQSMECTPSDEILTTNHVYNGVRQLLSHHAQRTGCSYRELEIPLPVMDSNEILSTIVASFSSKTTLLVVDHVASITSIVFPIEEIIKECHKRDIKVLVDGAHAPGMLDVRIDSLNADWYVGNLHKWVCAPVGAGFVWTHEKHRGCTHPLTVSHFLNTNYTDEFDWQGTKDISPWLAAATAIQIGDSIGWDRIREHNHTLVTWMHQELLEGLSLDSIVPIDGSLFGSMATVLLPTQFPNTYEGCDQLRDQIFQEFKIEVPILLFENRCFVRVSAQLYTKSSDIGHLIDVLRGIRQFS
jgi:isopenicillin-N epimerase